MEALDVQPRDVLRHCTHRLVIASNLSKKIIEGITSERGLLVDLGSIMGVLGVDLGCIWIITGGALGYIRAN